MTNQETIDKMEFCKRAYQRLIDENSQEGVFVGKGFEGKWKADTPLYKVYEDMRDACDMAIKALEQEPCEDAVSREQALSGYADWYGYGYQDSWFYKHLKNMSSINPQEPKTGHWIAGVNGHFNCSECNTDFFAFRDIRAAFIYCPYCGVRMVEPQESEDKE